MSEENRGSGRVAEELPDTEGPVVGFQAECGSVRETNFRSEFGWLLGGRPELLSLLRQKSPSPSHTQSVAESSAAML